MRGYLSLSFYVVQVVGIYLLYTYCLPFEWKSWKFISTFGFHIFYWSFCFLHMYMDRHPQYWWGKYKVKQQEVITDTQMIPTVAFNLFMWFIFTKYLYHPYIKRGYVAEDINFIHCMLELAAYYVMYDFTFYYGHRFLHWKPVYERLHKKHHLTKGSIGISGLYMHPLDLVLESIIPTMVGPILLNGHIVTMMVWSCIAGVNSPHSHGGYEFPFFPSTQNHYLHHKYYIKNFGLGIFDDLHGTRCYT